MASPDVSDATKSKLAQEFDALDPVVLLRDIRSAQQKLSDTATNGSSAEQPSMPIDITEFFASLETAWKNGEVRPTHRRKRAAQRSWRTRRDPFEEVWPTVEGWPVNEPTVTAKDLMDRLARAMPEVYASKGQLRTLQRRIMAWRAEKAKELILGRLKRVPVEPKKLPYP